MKAIQMNDLALVEGGTAQNLVNTVNGACAVVGVASLFTGVGAFVSGFCAGWAVGTFLFS